jgi:gliding motility-associated-like protein
MLSMPNASTPNMDRKNDLFKPAKKSGCQFLTFSIFNRWGQKVFETSDLNKGWDGKMNGINQDTGLFVWVVIALKDRLNKFFKGTVTLVR